MMRYPDTSNRESKQAFTEQNREAALEAAAHGQPVFPVIVTRHPKNSEKKHAEFPEGSWKRTATTDPNRINRLWDKYPDATPGMMTGANYVVDLDQSDGKDGAAEYEAMGLDAEDALFAVDTPSGGQHLYFDNPFGLTISKDDVAIGIDTRGHGGFVFAPGSRTIFGEYKVKRGNLEDLKCGLLTPVPDLIRDTLKKPVEAEVRATPDNADLETIRDALSYVSSDCGYQEWVDILMAVHNATGGSVHGLGLVIGWSAGHPEFSPKEVQNKWRSFGQKDGRQIGIGTLFERAEENGWKRSDPEDLLTSDDVELNSLEDLDRLFLGDDQSKSRLTLLSPSECEDLPSRRYVIKGLLAEGDIGTVVGAPGAGKSLLAPYLAYMVAQGQLAFGRRTRQGGAFYVAAEDGLGMRGRVRALRDEYGEADGFRLVAGVSDLLAKNSPDLKELLKAVKRERPSLIVVDTIAVAFPGLEENDAKSMGQVVHVARQLARWGAAVLLIHHDTKGGSNGLPRGHSILNGALDVNLYLKREDGAVTGKLTKNRNGSTDEKLAFTVATIPLGEDEDGDTITTAICRETDASTITREKPLTKKQNAALGVLVDLIGDGERISVAEWREGCLDNPSVCASKKSNSQRAAFRRIFKELVKKEAVFVHGGFVSTAEPTGHLLTDDDVRDGT